MKISGSTSGYAACARSATRLMERFTRKDVLMKFVRTVSSNWSTVPEKWSMRSMRNDDLAKLAEYMAEKFVELGRRNGLDAIELLVVAAKTLDFIQAGFDNLNKIEGLGQFIVDNHLSLRPEMDSMMIAFSGVRARSGGMTSVMRLNSVTYNEIVARNGDIQEMYKMTGLYLASNIVLMSLVSGKEAGEILDNLSKLVEENIGEIQEILKGREGN